MSFKIPKIRKAFPFQRHNARQMNMIAEALNRGLVVDSPDIQGRRQQDGRVRLIGGGGAQPLALALAAPSPGGLTDGTFTEFYTQSGGSNLNAGSTTNNTPSYATTNGSWSTVTNIFTPTDGSNPVLSGIAVGDFCSIYIDGATTGVFVARITAVTNAVNGPITVSTTFRAGTAPSTSATARSLRVGGAWKGPNGSITFPFSLATTPGLSDLRNVSNNLVRLNFKNDQTYLITAGINISSGNSYLTVQGFSSTPGDGGIAIFDAQNNGITIFQLQVNGRIWMADLIARNTSASSTAWGFYISATEAYLFRCQAENIGGYGINLANSNCLAIGCTVTNCNKSNASGQSGFGSSSGCHFINCVSQNNVGSNNDGFAMLNGAADVVYILCTSKNNGRHGFAFRNMLNRVYLQDCVSQGNSGDGINNLNTTSDSVAIISGCDFSGNSGFGINSALTTGRWLGAVSGTNTGSRNNTDSLMFD